MKGLEGVIAAAAEVEKFCNERRWRFCFIGGLAVQRWGMPRFTQDVDATLLTGWGGETAFIDALLQQFPGRLSTARQFAIDHRVLLAKTTSGIPLDFALGAFPFEEESIANASPWEPSPGTRLTTCSAEDLVIHKVFAGRDRDWADVETIIERQGQTLRLAYIRTQLPLLLELKEDTSGIPKFERMVSEVQRRRSD